MCFGADILNFCIGFIKKIPSTKVLSRNNLNNLQFTTHCSFDPKNLFNFVVSDFLFSRLIMQVNFKRKITLLLKYIP